MAMCDTCEGSRRVQLLPARGIRLGPRKMFMDCPECKPVTSIECDQRRHIRVLHVRLSGMLAVILIESLLFAAYVLYTT